MIPGLDQLDARCLNPATDSFTTTDPIPQLTAVPQTSDYLDTGGQHTVLGDPSGEISFGSVLAHFENGTVDLATDINSECRTER